MDNEPANFADALRTQLASATGEAPKAEPTPAPAPERAPISAEVAQPAGSAGEDARLARIITQAQQVRAEREAFKREQEERRADMEELARYRELKSRAKDDPVAWAEAGGYKPDEYATTLVEKGAFTPEKRRIFDLERKLSEQESRWQTYEKQQKEQRDYQAYNQTVSALKNFAEQAGENYDLVRRSNAYNLVIEKFHKHYQDTSALGNPEELPWEQAFEQAEAELLTKYEPVLESPKIRSRYGAMPSAPAPQSASTPAPAARPSGSISPKNRGNTQPPRDLSEAEGLEAAGRYLFRQFGTGR